MLPLLLSVTATASATSLTAVTAAAATAAVNKSTAFLTAPGDKINHMPAWRPASTGLRRLFFLEGFGQAAGCLRYGRDFVYAVI